ncbi:hypothetical protein L6164_021224 [Bauhinia variegata]|uniref:Uncharacterized protein n=1 Tax=Bauhinia variegata TaxID=167791 RepID=A0ACB9N196_BAUVA|nr:hypothetical protein L6164_021224 [Bauhinia variegata]
MRTNRLNAYWCFFIRPFICPPGRTIELSREGAERRYYGDDVEVSWLLCLLDNVKPGIWIPGSHDIKKRVDGAAGANFEVKHFEGFFNIG